MSARTDYLGNEAERTLQSLCDQVQIVANRVTCDKGGWDYLLQLPIQREGPITSLDQLPVSPVCLVQVKGTDTNKYPPQIKLTNVERFASWHGPAFFFVGVFEGLDRPARGYLVPFDKEWVERYVKRLRELSPEQLDDLHKHEMVLNWNGDHQLPALTGTDLCHAIRKHVGSDMTKYIDQKARWRREAGVDRARFQMRFTIVPSKPTKADEDLLIDFALGLEKRLPIRLLATEEVRFGIAKPLPQQLPTEVFLEIPELKPHSEIPLTFLSRKRALQANFVAGFFSPGGFVRDLPTERTRFRFSTPMFEMVTDARGQKANLRFHVDWKQSYPLEVQGNTGQLIDLLGGRREERADLEIVFPAGIAKNEIRLEGFSFDGVQMPDGLREWAFAACNAWHVAKALNLSMPSLQAGEIRARSNEFLRCRLILAPNPGETRLQIPDDDPENREGMEVGYPHSAGCRIGDNVIVVGGAISGKLKRCVDEGGSWLRLEDPSIHILTKEVVAVASLAKSDAYDLRATQSRAWRWLRDRRVDILIGTDPLAEAP